MERFKAKFAVLAPVALVKNSPAVRGNSARLAGHALKQILALLVVAALAFGCFQFSQRYLLQSVQVTGDSMSPTLPDTNWYLLNRLVYRFREPRPGEIVVLSDPQVQGFAVKRIVARPGDTVLIKGGEIYVNGKPLDEPYLKPHTSTYSDPDHVMQSWVCRKGQYFVLGDNRNNSTDSRIYGTVPIQSILGMVMP